MSMPQDLMQTLTLADLLGDAGAERLPVTGIALDSRRVGKGDVFFAARGRSTHGLGYLADAIARGCSAVVYDPANAPRVTAAIPMIAVEELDRHLGTIADRFYGSPSAALDVIGITGTNGKTTVSWLLAEALQLLHRKAAYSGTLGYGLFELAGADGMTTPDVFETHRRLAELRDAGADSCAMEVSSHALDQGRVHGLRFSAVVFTNLSRDHLDYHADMADYEAAKARLFREYETRSRIINIDTPAGRRLAESGLDGILSVSMQPDAAASLVVRSAEATPSGFELAFDSVFGAGEFHLPLPGSFNVENAACVLATLLSMGVSVADATTALSNVTAPPGRLERAAAGSPLVLVDYAHTPDALRAVLDAVRSNCRGRLWCVFGCGGDRDRGKRVLMAAVAERCADHVVVTSDNPRSEEPEAIIDDICAGFSLDTEPTVIADRRLAIRHAVSNAAADDVVLIAGKGHEEVQIVGDRQLPFSDIDIARESLAARPAESQPCK